MPVAYFYDVFFSTFFVDLSRRPGHRHGAAQLTISLDRKPHRAGPTNAALRPGLVHYVGTHEPHSFDGDGGEQMVFWLTPESRVCRELNRAYLCESGHAVLPAELLDGIPTDALRAARDERWPGERLESLIDGVLSTLTRATPLAEPIHPAVRRATRIIHALPVKKISADVLAAKVDLSKSRLLHLFKEHLGIPLRPYLAWLRSVDAMVMMAEGANCTEAAIGAGFTDGAHLNRVMHGFSGVTASKIAASMQIEVHVQRP